jgi:AAA+ ATPase superfamily predicted ATPase
MKAVSANPFNPQFGKRPAKFVGRDQVINDFLSSLENKNDPNRNTILTGIRGSGKTSILSDIHESLDDKKYLVVDITAGDGMLLAILDECARNGKKWLGKKFSGYDSVTVGGFGFSIGLKKKDESNVHGFRYSISEILGTLKKNKIGIVFLIDEVHNDTPEMREFATTYQHLVRENNDVALLMAGLPSSVQDILNDKVLTFLRRAHRVYLENVHIEAVKIAYEEAFGAEGRKFLDDTARSAAQATDGYPYLIQLVGYYMWKTERTDITADDLANAVILSKADMFQNIHDLVVGELSARDKDFLKAMSVDEQESEFGDIAKRMGVTSGYASKYRERLLRAGVIHKRSYGKLSFTPPYMREYIFEHFK